MRLTCPFILASSSPRRQHLLKQVGFTFTVQVAGVDEEFVFGEDPSSIVGRLATLKAEKVARQNPDALVLGADTIVVLDDDVLGKPESALNAVEMLKRLSGRTHTVYTGFALFHSNAGLNTCDVESTRVTMYPASDELIRQYVATGSPMDKAGSYGIQDMGAFLVSRIDGDFYTVMGLPLHRLYKRLTETFSEFLVHQAIHI